MYNFARMGLTHSGGTKFYEAVLIEARSGNAVVVKRWGKVASWGRVKVEEFSNHSAADAAYREVLEQKRKRGYTREDYRDDRTLSNMDEVEQALVQYKRNAAADYSKIIKALTAESAAEKGFDTREASKPAAKPSESIDEQIKHQPSAWGSW